MLNDASALRSEVATHLTRLEEIAALSKQSAAAQSQAGYTPRLNTIDDFASVVTLIQRGAHILVHD